MASDTSNSPLVSKVLSHSRNGSRQSFDSDRVQSPPPNGVNGTTNGSSHDDLEGLDPLQRLQKELERTKEEKETLATQYRNLLSKLTTMRTTLGNKLKQDAEELDRQEQVVQQLTAQNEDLVNTIETLKSEVIASNEEAERASKELEAMRSRVFQESAQEAYMKEREVRELQGELEQCRIERDELEQNFMQSQLAADEAKAALESARRDLEIEREAREREEAELAVEREKSANLQSVLEDFQAAKDHELKQAVKDYETQLLQTTQSLAEYKHRALNAELQLEETTTDSSRTHELEKEVKEKNLLIGKLRHEAVIMNEHLMEALRRLRRSSTDTNVDRRLVTNVLLSFLTTPRADSKRFEMLSLLATILQWSDDEREKAGLQRTSISPSQSKTPSIWTRALSPSSSRSSAPEVEKTDETESFSRLWVEFLLTEAASGEGATPPKSPSRTNNSLPGTPTRPSYSPTGHLSPNALKGGQRLPSFTAAAMASSPNLHIHAPPPPPLPMSKKGKEKAVDLTQSP
ncbi:hypothetical protein C8Q75DRAFT_419351 [Abortiporus biennis]|nr:hypothetical protein C8Q75DRAFT_419351 [Abortiporus biennis]